MELSLKERIVIAEAMEDRIRAVQGVCAAMLEMGTMGDTEKMQKDIELMEIIRAKMDVTTEPILDKERMESIMRSIANTGKKN